MNTAAALPSSSPLRRTDAAADGTLPADLLPCRSFVCTAKYGNRFVVRCRGLKTPNSNGSGARVNGCRSGAALFAGIEALLAGVLNSCGNLCRWSFGALVQPAKQSSRRFCVSFSPFVVPVHVPKHERGALKCPTNPMNRASA